MDTHKAFWKLAWSAAEGLLLMLPINADLLMFTSHNKQGETIFLDCLSLFIMVYFSYQVVMHSCSAD